MKMKPQPDQNLPDIEKLSKKQAHRFGCFAKKTSDLK